MTQFIQSHPLEFGTIQFTSGNGDGQLVQLGEKGCCDGQYQTCFTNDAYSVMNAERYSLERKSLVSWGGASIAFLVLAALVLMVGIILISVVCCYER